MPTKKENLLIVFCLLMTIHLNAKVVMHEHPSSTINTPHEEKPVELDMTRTLVKNELQQNLANDTLHKTLSDSLKKSNHETETENKKELKGIIHDEFVIVWAIAFIIISILILSILISK